MTLRCVGAKLTLIAHRCSRPPWQIHAPSGPLGIIFVDSEYGPIVQYVRATSPIVSQVRRRARLLILPCFMTHSHLARVRRSQIARGDFVMNLDGEDTLALSADQLAKLLIAGADNPERVLTVSACRVGVQFRSSPKAKKKRMNLAAVAPAPFEPDAGGVLPVGGGADEESTADARYLGHSDLIL